MLPFTTSWLAASANIRPRQTGYRPFVVHVRVQSPHPSLASPASTNPSSLNWTLLTSLPLCAHPKPQSKPTHPQALHPHTHHPLPLTANTYDQQQWLTFTQHFDFPTSGLRGRGKCLSVCFGRGFVHEVLGAGLTSFVNRMFDNDGDEGLHFDPKLLFCQH